ncbi:MAG: CoA transferase [Acetobacteraceae bacterium]|nr:CoA transferase [Acetobacteraceae bacterium]MDW8399219.1 CaiB/BaiF CoA-transferase family protein [Acetobacteraceae bacterium]
MPDSNPTGAAATTQGALAGLKVIDLTRVLGGPYCTMILADHGAEVIKIEPPQGDETRGWGPPFDAAGDASYFLGVNRNKRALALDLTRPEGRAVLLRLLDGADVLIENYKPGTMERWGLGYEALGARFPRLIHCRVSGFGGDGPLGGLPGYDAVLQAMVGLMSVNGDPASGSLRMGTPVVDLATGLYAAIAILMALAERSRSGRGQYCDMTLHDCGMALLHPQAANFFLNGKRPVATGNAHPNISPYSKFPTATAEIFIACGNDPTFRRLCDLLGLDGVAADPRFATNADRVRNRPELDEILNARLAEEDGIELADRLLRNGVPAGPVLAVDQAMAAPHTAHRGMVVEAEGLRFLGSPIKLSRTPAVPPRRPPRFNEQAEEILTAHGFSPEEIAELTEAGVVVSERR